MSDLEKEVEKAEAPAGEILSITLGTPVSQAAPSEPIPSDVQAPKGSSSPSKTLGGIPIVGDPYAIAGKPGEPGGPELVTKAFARWLDLNNKDDVEFYRSILERQSVLPNSVMLRDRLIDMPSARAFVSGVEFHYSVKPSV